MENKEIVLGSFKLPTKHFGGYIFDANNQMMMEVRGWGHLQYGPDAEAVQDTMGEMFALAFNEMYASRPPASPPAPAIEGKEEDHAFFCQAEYDGSEKCKSLCYICGRDQREVDAMGEDDSADQVHVQLPSGAVAKVSPDASPELLEALDKMCEIAKSADIPLTGDIKVDGNPLRNSTIGTPLAGAEGEGEIPEDELDADRLLGKLEASRKYNAALMKQLSAANAKIAELEQTIREQKEWINSHL